jgi:hypothetical protein
MQALSTLKTTPCRTEIKSINSGQDLTKENESAIKKCLNVP